MKAIVFLLATFLFDSCNIKKKYTYIETIKSMDLMNTGYEEEEKKPVIISASNDLQAYSEAYKDFYISKKACEMVARKLKLRHPDIPIKFELLNDKKENIYNTIDFLAK